MMKIAPASRLVTDASLSPGAPPSIERSRPIRPPGGEVADWASVTATARNPRNVPRGAAMLRPINYSLRFGWVSMSSALSEGRRTAGPKANRDVSRDDWDVGEDA